MVLSAAGEAATNVIKCDRGEVGVPCEEKAVFAYQWDWGEKGTCCATHATLLQQIANQLSRTVSLHPLLPSAPEPLQRDERTQLKAAKLVLEEELEDAKSRGLDLYRINGQLRGDVQLLTVRNTEADAQLRDAAAEISKLREQVAARDRENANLVARNSDLETLAAFSPTERHELGLEEGGAVVDG